MEDCSKHAGLQLKNADHRKQCYSKEQTKILEQMNEVNAQIGAKVTKQEKLNDVIVEVVDVRISAMAYVEVGSYSESVCHSFRRHQSSASFLMVIFADTSLLMM